MSHQQLGTANLYMLLYPPSLPSPWTTCACKESKRVKSDVFAKHHHLEKHRRRSKKRKRSRKDSPISSPSPGRATIPQDAPEVPFTAEIDDGGLGDMAEAGNVAGPSNIQDPPPIISVRSGRRIRLPARYTDFLPGDSTGLRQAPPPPPAEPSPVVSSANPSRLEPPQSSRYETDPNHFGLFRVYPTQPTLIPEAETDLSAAVDAPTLESHPQPTIQ
ncbi:hypothetical protein HYDPIDRAFT_34820 [Hydnomerulius pinastri MD-312]|uniref:Unplaced genomic scaffold scaffold_300, whole genome shotgun sequence n=1 Tax=Hydnomerulius pinastri MD-312 TaxID=994086 RepID=A0A0C9W5E3_9AGAM|nr:hypothetical protein HYDPIDRAFT_34820 [Hydnomerulius pinastri MD-312]